MILLEIITEPQQLSIASSLYPAIPANHERKEGEKFILPSEGEVKEWDNPEAACGETKYTIKCKDEYSCKHPVDLVPWDCGRYECPVCYKRALVKGAVGVREHVWNTLLEMKKVFPRTKWFLSSVIISAPREVHDLDYDKQHYYLRKAIKHLGTSDVAAIYHRWRYRNLETGEELEKIPWKEYQSHPDRYKRVLSPHWHCFVVGRMVKSPIFFEKTNGWVYKKMKTDNGSYVLKQKDVYQIAYYALSHAALSTSKRRHATHYYGNFWRLTVTEKRYTTEPVICPKCNNQRVRRQEYRNMYGDDCHGLEEPAVKLIIHRKYKLRGCDYADLDGGLDFTGYHAPVKEVEYVDIKDV